MSEKINLTPTELKNICMDIMNLGLSLRQNQLNGTSVKSGNSVVEEYLKENKLDIIEKDEYELHYDKCLEMWESRKDLVNDSISAESMDDVKGILINMKYEIERNFLDKKKWINDIKTSSLSFEDHYDVSVKLLDAIIDRDYEKLETILENISREILDEH